ncbi:MAG: hypothetical protein ACOY0T_31180 [Myxococcota bacterium]
MASAHSPSPSAEHDSDLSPELVKLRNGELTMDCYLDHQADDAVAHLSGALNAEQLQAVRGVIRSQLEADPVLMERVRRLVDDEKRENGP